MPNISRAASDKSHQRVLAPERHTLIRCNVSGQTALINLRSEAKRLIPGKKNLLTTSVHKIIARSNHTVLVGRLLVGPLQPAGGNIQKRMLSLGDINFALTSASSSLNDAKLEKRKCVTGRRQTAQKWQNEMAGKCITVTRKCLSSEPKTAINSSAERYVHLPDGDLACEDLQPIVRRR